MPTDDDDICEACGDGLYEHNRYGTYAGLCDGCTADYAAADAADRQYASYKEDGR